MVGYLLVILICFIGGVNTFVNKKWQIRTNNIKDVSFLYILITAAAALPVYFVISGFNVVPNKTVMILSAAHGVICVLSMTFMILAYKTMNLILHSVFSSGSTVLVWLIGVFVFKEYERISVTGITSIVLLICAILLPLKRMSNNKTGIKGYLVGVMIMLISAGASTVTKLYSSSPTKLSDGMFCFYANVFVLAYLIAEMLIMKKTKAEIVAFKASGKSNLLIVVSVLLSAISSPVSLYILRTMPLSVYTVLTLALGSIETFISSLLIFKERPTRLDVASLLLSTAAAVVAIF